MGLSSGLSCEAGSFSCCCLNAHKCFHSEVLRLYFPSLESWVAFLSHFPVVPPCLSAHKCGTTCFASHYLAPSPLLRSCLSLPLLLVWVSVSSLTPWLLDFHTVRFSGSSGCFLFLNLLLSFFLLYEEAQCVYSRLHLGRKCLEWF